MPKNGPESVQLALERFVPYRLSVLANTVSRSIANEYAQRFGLSVPEWRILAVLGRFAPLTASGICARTAMDKVAVSRGVARLTKAGLLKRRTDKDDRRRVLLEMSRAGRGVYRDIVPLALAREADLLAALSVEEVRQFDRLMEKLQGRADALAGVG
ncbi:MAG: MarR family winged helix-turn-helix transcriptional regulator [Alphaproteobacteria bacterium]